MADFLQHGTHDVSKAGENIELGAKWGDCAIIVDPPGKEGCGLGTGRSLELREAPVAGEETAVDGFDRQVAIRKPEKALQRAAMRQKACGVRIFRDDEKIDGALGREQRVVAYIRKESGVSARQRQRRVLNGVGEDMKRMTEVFRSPRDFSNTESTALFATKLHVA